MDEAARTRIAELEALVAEQAKALAEQAKALAEKDAQIARLEQQVRSILEHLGLPAVPLPIEKARGPPQAAWDF